MSQRYDRLFLFRAMYAEQSPLLLSAGALLKDNQTGKILAQLKMENLNSARITAVTVCIQPMDAARRPLGKPVFHQYLDLNVPQNAEFGQQTPIPMPSASRSFSVEITEVIFDDFSVWHEQNKPWLPLAPRQELQTVLPQDEVRKQYKLLYGADCRYFPAVHQDLWYCACGKTNHTTNEVCTCGKQLSVLLACDLNELQNQTNLRLEEERLEREARQIAEREEKEKKKAQRLALFKKYWYIPAAAAVLLTVLAATSAISHKKHMDAYEHAAAMLTIGNYEEAIEEFAALEDFRDSAEQKHAAEEALAAKIAEEQRLAEEAARQLAEQQAAEREAAQEENRRRAAYAIAAARMQRGEYASALSKWEELDGYRDSDEQAQICRVELIWQDFLQTTTTDVPNFPAAEAALEQLTAMNMELAAERLEEGYCKLTALACDQEDPEQAERYLTQITNAEEAEPLQQEIAYLKLYVQAKAITVESKETRTSMKELLDQLPEEYREVSALHQRIKDYDKKQSAGSYVSSKGEEVELEQTMANIAGNWKQLQQWKKIPQSNGSIKYGWTVSAYMNLRLDGTATWGEAKYIYRPDKFATIDKATSTFYGKTYLFDQNGDALLEEYSGTWSIGTEGNYTIIYLSGRGSSGENVTKKVFMTELTNKNMINYGTILYNR